MSTKQQSIYEALASSCLSCDGEVLDDALSLQATFCFETGFPGFDGHFPGQPVLPAVVLLAAVRYSAEKVLERTLAVVGYDHAKFRGMIKPDERIEINIALVEDNTRWSGKYSVKNETGDNVSSGNCQFNATTQEREK